MECLALNHQAIPVNMWWSISFSFSVWILPPVETIQSRNNENCWASNLPKHLLVCHVCGGLFLSLSLCGYCCLWTIQSRNNSELLSIKYLKQHLPVCGGNILILICGCLKKQSMSFTQNLQNRGQHISVSF